MQTVVGVKEYNCIYLLSQLQTYDDRIDIFDSVFQAHWDKKFYK